MILNGIPRIKEDGGDFVVLVDYGCEGMSVWSQHETAEDAILSLPSGTGGSPTCLVRLVRFELTLTEE